MNESESVQLDGIRVLVLFGGAELFGQERANLEVFRNLAQLGLKARFITSSKWGRQKIQPELDRLGFEWTTASYGYQWTKHMLGRHFGYFLLNLYGVVATSWCVWRETRRWRPTHLYVMNWTFFSYAAPAIQLLHLPLIYRAGDMLPVQTGFHRWLCRLLFLRLTVLVSNSHFIARKLRAIAPPDLAIQVIHNFPPGRTAIPAELPIKPPPGAVVVVYVGQVAEHKGVHLLVEAVISLIKTGRNLALLVAGESGWDGTLAVRLQVEVQTEKLEERIRFLGYVDNVPGLLRQAHIHACPSVWEEPSPNVVMEAKREGVPSVVFASGGIPELIEHRVDGYICRARTAAALAEGIEYFAANAAEQKRAGAAARRSLDQEFGVGRFRRDWVGVFLASWRKQRPATSGVTAGMHEC